MIRVGRRTALLGIGAVVAVAGCPATTAPRPAPAVPEPPRPVRPDAVLVGWPDRPSGAPTGSEFAEKIRKVVGPLRDDAILRELEAGNVPDFLRAYVAVGVPAPRAGATEQVGTVWVTCDYLAIGSDDDFLRIPMLPRTAQTIVDRVDALLPTRRVVDLVYAAAPVHLRPIAIEPGPLMIASDGYRIHNDRIEAQRRAAGLPLGALTAGHKKDIVVTPALRPGRLAIYGFHRGLADPIQKLNLSHSSKYVDYAHGVRLLRGTMRVGSDERRVAEVLLDPATADLLSDEGPIASPRYA